VHSITAGWGDPLPHLFAVLSGATIPQVGSMVRARWAHLVGDEQDRHTAFAVEAVGDEVVFVTGPALVTFLSTLYAPQTGLLVALGVGRLLSRMLYGVSPTDPLAFGGVALLLVGVALLASWIPARRAARVDPMVALRAE
jgi:hypothetical protein